VTEGLVAISLISAQPGLAALGRNQDLFSRQDAKSAKKIKPDTRLPLAISASLRET
jgi:hypothetical protein